MSASASRVIVYASEAEVLVHCDFAPLVRTAWLWPAWRPVHTPAPKVAIRHLAAKVEAGAHVGDERLLGGGERPPGG